MGRIPILLMARQLTEGGCERDLTRLALGFRESRFDPHVACFRAGGMRYEELRAAGIGVYPIELTSLKSPGAFAAAWRLARYARQHRIRLLHAMDAPAAYFATPVCRLAGVPAILACQLSYRSMVAPFEQRLLGLADRLADGVVSNSQAVLDDLTANYGVARAKTALIYNGVELDRFHPPAGGGRDRSPLPERFRDAAMVVGAVCALRAEKKLDTLIEAFAKLDPASSGVRLAIVGSGKMESAWKQRATALGVGEHVHFEPRTPHVEQWMRAFDAFVLSSKLEAFPNGLLEAMACGCAPVGSQVGGVPEMLGSDGLMFPVGDSAALAARLAALLSDPLERARLGAAAARRAAERFSLRENLRRTAEVYTATLGEKGVEVETDATTPAQAQKT